MEIPASVYVALGAVAAALVAGFFSFLSLVSSKENKVSEFRHEWIVALRSEVSIYSSSIQALAKFRSIEDSYKSRINWMKDTKDIYKELIESLSRIQLSLNPQHAKDRPDSHEAKLLSEIHTARNLLNDGKLWEASQQSQKVREVAAFFLKDEWERVKNGEARYQRTRNIAQKFIICGIILLALLAITSLAIPFFMDPTRTSNAEKNKVQTSSPCEINNTFNTSYASYYAHSFDMEGLHSSKTRLQIPPRKLQCQKD